MENVEALPARRSRAALIGLGVTRGRDSSSDLDVRWLMVALLSGCSVIAVRGPQTTPTGKVCHSTYVPPVIDTVIAAAGVALIVYSATDKAGNPETDGHALTEREAAVYPGMLLAIPFSLSALHGYSKVS